MEILLPGDIFAINIDTFWRRMSKMFLLPKSDMYHFGMIYCRSLNDYVILESLFKDIITGETYWRSIFRNSLRSGLLSRYSGYNISILRPVIIGSIKEQQGKRELAIERLCSLSGTGWDLKGAIKEGLKSIVRGKPPWDYRRLKYKQGRKYTCLGILVQAWAEAGFQIITPNVFPTPSAMEEAIREGKLTVIFKGIY